MTEIANLVVVYQTKSRSVIARTPTPETPANLSHYAYSSVLELVAAVVTLRFCFVELCFGM